jgi:carotenoid cleavage dioxygenase-like enzyme
VNGSSDVTIINGDAPTRLIVVDLEDGSSATYDSPEPFLCEHFNNVYETADETGEGEMLVFEMPTWQTPMELRADTEKACNPYKIFDFDRIMDKEKLDGFNTECVNQLVKHTITISGPNKGEVSFDVLDGGWYEYPIYNRKFLGRKSCFLYLVEYYHERPDFGAIAIVKYDTCLRKRVAEWYEVAHFPSEPHFIGNPDADEDDEDDGVIVTPIMDGTHDERLSYFLILNAKDLTELARMPMGDSVPSTVHGWFKFDN